MTVLRSILLFVAAAGLEIGGVEDPRDLVLFAVEGERPG